MSKIKTIVVDDSAVVRGLLVKTLETDAGIDVVHTAMNGERLLSHLDTGGEADVIVLDVEMPVMDGLTTLEHMTKKYPEIKVIMASSLTQKGAEITVRALTKGAVGCVAKPSGGVCLRKHQPIGCGTHSVGESSQRKSSHTCFYKTCTHSISSCCSRNTKTTWNLQTKNFSHWLQHRRPAGTHKITHRVTKRFPTSHSYRSTYASTFHRNTCNAFRT